MNELEVDEMCLVNRYKVQIKLINKTIKYYLAFDHNKSPKEYNRYVLFGINLAFYEENKLHFLMKFN